MAYCLSHTFSPLFNSDTMSLMYIRHLQQCEYFTPRLERVYFGNTRRLKTQVCFIRETHFAWLKYFNESTIRFETISYNVIWIVFGSYMLISHLCLMNSSMIGIVTRITYLINIVYILQR